jgi:hypothetical protein
MNQPPLPVRDPIIDPMIALARCSPLQRIVVAGTKSVELMLELHRCGYVRTSATANCGRPAGQYDVALVDWRQRAFRALESRLDWVADFLAPAGVLVVWVDSQKPAAVQSLRSALGRRGFIVEAEAVRDYGFAMSARRKELSPIAKAA